MMTEEIYQTLLQAVELGKWQDGTPLTREQQENSLQAVMLWQSRHNSDADHLTINTLGELVRLSKQALKQRLQQEEHRINLISQPDH
ncbi:MAG: YeaC family protein [Enterobacteriaceae bacterium]